MKKEDTKKIVQQAYGKIAKEKTGCGCSPDADEFAKSVGYSTAELKSIPPEANLGLSCGNPTAFAALKKGETVLDLGSGAGFDCFLAAQKVGPSGKVIGVDITPEMIAKAKDNAKKWETKNVEFRLGEIESLPVEDNSVDAIISNCVINLSADKLKAYKEAYRALKPGGRLAISDMALLKELPEAVRRSIEAYVGCVAGAILVKDYQRIVEAAGFKAVKITVKGDSSCVDSNTKDPLGKAMLDSLGDKDALANSGVVSVYVEGYK